MYDHDHFTIISTSASVSASRPPAHRSERRDHLQEGRQETPGHAFSKERYRAQLILACQSEACEQRVPESTNVTMVALVSSECLIKSLINPRNVVKMESTFGTWMKDTAMLNDERIWVAEHFSGRTASVDSMLLR